MVRPQDHCRSPLTATVSAALVLTVAWAGPAVAADPAVPPTPPPAATTPAPPAEPPAEAPAPVKAKLRIQTQRTPGGTVLKGDRWRVLATLSPAVPGTRAIVSFTSKGRTVKKTVTLRTSKNGKRSLAALNYRSRSASRVIVRARIGTDQPASATTAKRRIVLQATPSVRPGQRGSAVRILQSMLRAKGYVIGSPGVFDARTQRAVLAFRKVTGMQWTTQGNSAVFRALRAGKGTFRVRFPSHGRHVEGDIRRQVLALIGSDGKPDRIYHTSPGAPATPTIRGSFRVYMKDPGTNAKGMYKSSYFIRGYAVHGYPSVPTYNASHGCFRVPMADAASIYAWMSMGMRVDTY